MRYKKPLIGITLDVVDPQTKPYAKEFSVEPWYALRYRYSQSIEACGGVPFTLPHEPSCVQDYVETLDGLLITGGGFDVDPTLYGDTHVHPSIYLKPARTTFEWALCEAFLKAGKPILGICGGMQLLNVVLKGTLHQHVPDLHPIVEGLCDHSPTGGGLVLAHDVILADGGFLKTKFGNEHFQINSVHHQAVKQLGQGLIVSALAPDGLIEAFEHKDHNCVVGVQWHPEFLRHALDRYVIENFIQAAVKCKTK